MSFSTFAARPAHFLLGGLLLGLVSNLSACGTDGGTPSFLPPGPATTAPPGDLVLYVADALSSRIEAYRIGTDGLLSAKPFDFISVELPDNYPDNYNGDFILSKIILSDGVLYASLFDTIISIKLNADGSMPNRPTSSTLIRDDNNNNVNYSEPVDMLIQDGMLYVAASGIGRVLSYELNDDGSLPLLPNGSGQGQFPADYVSLAINGDFLYAGSRQSQYIDVFLLNEDGSVPPLAEPQDPQDSIALPDDIIIRDNILYVTSGGDRSVRAYILRSDAFVGADYDSRTRNEEYYENILLEGDLLYAAAYNAGRIDLFTVNSDGMFPGDGAFYQTRADPASYPIDMIVNGGILYVAQGGLNRVDAYVLDSNGVPSEYPTSSTDQTVDDSFPVSIALHQLD